MDQEQIVFKNNLKEKLLKTSSFIENEYLEKYIDLIVLNKNNEKIKFKTQCHHIVPRGYYRINCLDVDNSIDNKVNLLHKDHVLAHYYLSLCTLGQLKHYNIASVIKSLNFRFFKIEPDYEKQFEFILSLDKYQDLIEELKIENSKKFIGTKRPKELVNQIANKLKQVTHTEEWNNKIRKKTLGRKVSEQTKEKQRSIHIGKKAINKDGKMKYVYPDEISKYVIDGWSIGGIGHTSWKKGLTKNNDPRIKSISEKRIGHKWTQEQKNKRLGSGNPMYNKHVSPETIEKIKQTKLKNGTNIVSEETKKKISNTLKGYIVVYNKNNICKHIRPEQLIEYEKQGFYRHKNI